MNKKLAHHTPPREVLDDRELARWDYVSLDRLEMVDSAREGWKIELVGGYDPYIKIVSPAGSKGHPAFLLFRENSLPKNRVVSCVHTVPSGVGLVGPATRYISPDRYQVIVRSSSDIKLVAKDVLDIRTDHAPRHYSSIKATSVRQLGSFSIVGEQVMEGIDLGSGRAGMVFAAASGEPVEFRVYSLVVEREDHA